MLPRSLCAFTAALLLLSGCNRAPAGEATVSDAWVRLPAVAGRPGAAYFTLHGGAAADRLEGVETAAAERAELHAGGMTGGMMTMRPMDGADLPAGGSIAFAPGGNHVMLFGLDPALKPGGTADLRFHLKSGATLTAPAKLVGTADPAPF